MRTCRYEIEQHVNKDVHWPLKGMNSLEAAAGYQLPAKLAGTRHCASHASVSGNISAVARFVVGAESSRGLCDTRKSLLHGLCRISQGYNCSGLCRPGKEETASHRCFCLAHMSVLQSLRKAVPASLRGTSRVAKAR